MIGAGPAYSFLSQKKRDAERRAGEVEASFKKQLRAVQERERSVGLSTERRLREEGELAQRLSSRNTDLQVQQVAVGLSIDMAHNLFVAEHCCTAALLL